MNDNMDLSRKEYPALLATIEPEQAIDILNDRLALINQIHASIAEWLQERRRIEETYAASLRKLSHRSPQDEAALGIFRVPWQRIVAAAESMAQSHETLASKIETDVENPLRQYHVRSRDVQNMTNIHGNLAAIARQLSTAQRKNKGEKLEDAQQQWDSTAPYVFEQLQGLDESRINHLRDVLTQLETHELDQIERSRTSAELCLNALLNIETSDEIRNFATTITSRRASGVANRASVADGVRNSASIPPTPPPPRHPHNSRNDSTGDSDRLAPLTDPREERKSKLGGLKRLGTVMRKKNPAPPPPSQTGKKEKTRSSLFRRTESSKSFQDLENTGQDLTSTPSRDEPQLSRSELESPLSKRVSRTLEHNGETAPGINGVRPTSYQPNVQADQVSSPLQSTQHISQPPAPAITRDVEALSAPTPTQSIQPDLPLPVFADAPLTEDSSRNLKIQDRRIEDDASEAQLAMNNMASQLRIQAQSSGLNRTQGSFRGRRDVRNTVFMPAPVELGSPSTNSSLDAAPNPAPPVSALTPDAGDMAPITDGDTSLHESPVQARRLIPIESSIPEDAPPSGLLSDGQSIRSAQSTGIAFNHTDLNEAGLQASIIETVSTSFSASTPESESRITQSLVVGEIALAYNSLPAAISSQTHETVRLQNFHMLDKCAQNPAFVTASNTLPEPGTYNVALHMISKPQPTIAFKYQLHLPVQQSGLYSPILIEQAWQILEGQAQVIILYSLNPAFRQTVATDAPSSGVEELVLRNVQFTVSLDSQSNHTSAPASPRALNAQMMPATNAVFKKRTGHVVFKFPQLRITNTHERLLVRFIVESHGIAKRGGVDLKFELPDLLASSLNVERLNSATHNTEADPFADDEEVARRGAEGLSAVQEWQFVPSRKMLVSGKYTSA